MKNKNKNIFFYYNIFILIIVSSVQISKGIPDIPDIPDIPNIPDFPPNFRDFVDFENIPVNATLKSLNSRKMTVEVDSNNLTIESIRDQEKCKDKYDFSVDLGSKGINLSYLYYNQSNTSVPDIDYNIRISNLIEYIDKDKNNYFDYENDTILNNIDLKTFNPINYTILKNQNHDESLHIFQINSQENPFHLILYASDNFVMINQKLHSPSEIKLDFVIQDFDFTNELSRLAVNISSDFSVDINLNNETENERLNFAKNETELAFNSAQFTGFFSWQNYANIDNVASYVQYSPVLFNPNSSRSSFMLNYEQGDIIFHDPKIGVNGLIKEQGVFKPTSLWEKNWFIVILIIIPLATIVSILMSKEDYFSYLKNRFMHYYVSPHRLSMEEVLENETRDKIIDHILKEPGIHYNELLRKIETSPSNLAWHLDILNKYKIIKQARVGKFLVFYPYPDESPLTKKNFELFKSEKTLQIFELIQKNPGIIQSKIALEMDMNRKSVKYHLDKLLKSKLIHYKKIGRTKKIYLVESEESFES